jgi:hypothetical protein
MSVLFWKVLTAVCLLWYTSVTVYVAWQGFGDIRTMLKKLGKKE